MNWVWIGARILAVWFIAAMLAAPFLARWTGVNGRPLTGEDDTSTKYPPDMEEFVRQALDDEWEQLEREQRGGTP